jgi:porphobilinogen synthase
MSFPSMRPRRLRRSETLRAMVRETVLTPRDFVLPLFAMPGKGERHEVSSMPGVFQLSVDQVVLEAKQAHELGVPAVILFGLPEHKDALGSSGWDANGPVARSVAALKETLPGLVVITDVCMCEYTDHGHCGKLTTDKAGHVDVDNDATLELLVREALCHARAGADIVAPSDMMDGRIGAIRNALDGEGFRDVAILSYAAKYASGFYGPFREAAESTPQMGDRRGYQMDPANAREALKEVKLDLLEGADMVMVKPALPYLDIIARVREAVDVPVAAYNVSGEYAMIKAAAKLGWIDEQRVMMETLTSIKRAGADMILTYHAVDAAKLLNG